MNREFKIVEPEFVSKAKQSAVAAVEARFAREEKKKKQADRRSRVKGCLAWLILLLIAAAGGVYFACYYYGVNVSEVHMRIHDAIKGRWYAQMEKVFRTAPVDYWKDAPSTIHPGKVLTNTMYHALVPEGGERVLLELTAVPGEDLRVRRLAPLDDPIDLSSKEFARLVAKTPYLISVDGKVYFCSPKKTSIDKDDFRASLFSGPQANRPPAGR